jgi:FkbM family methyltransferase
MSAIARLLPDRLRYSAWCWRKYYREAEIRLAGRLVRPGSRCLDIGANAGAYSYFMRRAGGLVEAFEPIPELAQDLRRRFGNGIAVHQVAASDANGTVEIHVPWLDGKPAYGYSSCEVGAKWENETAFTVETRTIDSFGFRDVSLMKIDVEGHELAVLEGAARTIAESRPALIIEAEERHRPAAVATTAAFLRQFGYRGLFLASGNRNPLEQFDIGRDQAHPETPGYVCNFIFLAN